MAEALAGKTALVTGASGGIGAATAVRLAEMGATVVVHGRNPDRTHGAAEKVRAVGGTARMLRSAASHPMPRAAEVVAATRAAVGTVDILVNNAGGDSAQEGMACWFDATPADWLATYDSNVGSMVRPDPPCARDEAAGMGAHHPAVERHRLLPDGGIPTIRAPRPRSAT